MAAALEQFVFFFVLSHYSWMTRPFLNTINIMNLTDLLGSDVSLTYGWHRCQAPQTTGNHSALNDRDISNLDGTSPIKGKIGSWEESEPFKSIWQQWAKFTKRSFMQRNVPAHRLAHYFVKQYISLSNRGKKSSINFKKALWLRSYMKV